MQSVEGMLDILQCPNCQSGSLSLRKATRRISLTAIELSDREIHCSSCEEDYPISKEGIPILWTPEIKSYLGFDGERDVAPADTISANMEVYDQISDHYLEHTRKDDAAKNRLLACVKSIDADCA